MNKKLDETLSEVFVKPEKGLDTELFVFDQLGIPEEEQKKVIKSYNPKERFKMMKKEYNLAKETIAKPLRLGETKDGKAYFFEYVNGDNITMCTYKLRVDRNLAYKVFNQLKETVNALHDKGYVHGDLVGGNNIMLTYDNNVKLIDFLYIPKDFAYKDLFVKLDNDAVDALSKYILGSKATKEVKYG